MQLGYVSMCIMIMITVFSCRSCLCEAREICSLYRSCECSLL